MNFRILLTTTLAAAALAAAGQRQLPIAAGAFHPVLSPDGTTLLFSTIDHTGLKSFDLNTGATSVIDTEAAAGFEPVFTNDGAKVLYRTASMIDGLVYRDVRSFDFNTSGVTTLAKPSRGNDNVRALAGDTYAYADFGAIAVSRNGVATRLNPVADAHTYLWASFSPAADRIAFTEPFKGVYVCAPDGSELRKVLDKGDYIAWAGDNTLIAVVSHDDGYVILDSSLVKIDLLSGAVTPLTAESVLVSEATAAADGTVVYSDIDGNMYVININTL